MKHAAEMGSVSMIYIRNFIKIGSGIQKLMHTDTQKHGGLISLLSFLKIRKLGQKRRQSRKDTVENVQKSKSVNIMWHVDQLLGNDREISNDTTVVAK
jgi:hypothetical protein